MRELSLKPSVLSAKQSSLRCPNFAGRRERGCGQHRSCGMPAVGWMMSAPLPPCDSCLPPAPLPDKG